jgi:hypothetical protein
MVTAMGPWLGDHGLSSLFKGWWSWTEELKQHKDVLILGEDDGCCW